MEVIDIVILANGYPSDHCNPSSAPSSLTRRDDPATDTTIGQAASLSTAQRASHASKEICQNWAVMLVFFALVAVTRKFPPYLHSELKLTRPSFL